ncbi:alcohol oxidase [Mollisia scopiformis]|uniref:Alcohol oxidase n=1 Tax=Mollisia scopiformis TaxID=149040 RepID=A0A194WSM8_MOLSC|nr:alcohol oxidase [Mollisia scopiformis]KUJ10689.1 alcohol oxidase [Mollisia scopiformis]
MASTTRYDEADLEVFDYVIIGGGTAGLTLAARLTEDSAVQVAVLEAGEKRFDDPHINIPGLMNTLYSDENYDWNFKTTPQPGLNGRTLAWPRGKVLGGSSAINFMMVAHPSRVDLDNWEKLGNPGWNFDTLQPYYRKAETMNFPSDATAEALGTAIMDLVLHGASGPVQTSFTESPGELDKAWGRTFKTLGLGPGSDPRAGHTLGGYSLLKFMDKSARRSHAGVAFYEPNAARENLTVLTGAFVQKIEFDTVQDVVTATGVRYTIEGKEHVIRTRGEVILAAGTVQSPQILELSGIGDKKRLENLGIVSVLDNSNVGENLQDHTLAGIGYEAIDGVPTAEMIKQPGVLDWAINEWATKGLGPLSAGVTGTAFLSHDSLLSSEEKLSLESRLEEILSATPQPTSPGLKKQLDLQKKTLLNNKEADLQFNFGATGINPLAGNDISQLFNHNDAGGYAGIVPALTHAFSRGSIHIQSPDPSIHPIIDPKYLSHPIDVELMISGLLFTQKLSETAPLSTLLKDNPLGTGKIIQPSFHVEGRLTREKAEEIVRSSMITSFHPVGTCSMLPREEGGVVDDRLRVYGVKRLRIVDASVVPLIVRGNIASTVYASAERAADIIKEDRKAV